MDVVINASPLILLSKINRLSLLNQLFDKAYIPSAVIQEISAIDKADMDVDLTAIEYEQIVVTNRVAVLGMLGRLHAGEVEVIVGALEKGVSTVILDENAARNKAKQLGLTVTGTLGILLKAKKQGFIEDIFSEIDGLKNAGMYISDSVINKIKDAL